MELRHLRAFLEIAKHGHFGHAAAALNVTQPALTQRIQALERDAGLPLFTRSPHGVHLTPAGQVLVPFAKSLIQIEERAQVQLRDMKAGITGRLGVAYLAHGDVATPVRIVTRFRQLHPAVAVETSSGYSSTNLQRLLDRDVDASFILVSSAIPDGVAVRPTGRDELVLALPTDNPLVRLDPVPVSVLRGQPLILFPSRLGGGFTAGIRRFLARGMGQEPNVVAEEPPDQAVQTVLESRGAVTLVSGRRASSAQVPGIVYRHLRPTPVFHFGVATAKDDPSPAVANFLKVVDDVAGFVPADITEGEEQLTGT